MISPSSSTYSSLSFKPCFCAAASSSIYYRFLPYSVLSAFTDLNMHFAAIQLKQLVAEHGNEYVRQSGTCCRNNPASSLQNNCAARRRHCARFCGRISSPIRHRQNRKRYLVLVVIAGILSVAVLGSLVGLREGTAVSAILVGFLVKAITAFFPDQRSENQMW